MSVIHLNQIKTHLLSKYKDSLDLSDVGGTVGNVENHTLSRGLSAFVIDSMCDCGTQKSGESVTDSGNDNGIDAIYVDSSNSIIYVVQSKWIHSGKGEPSNGDVKKYLAGIRDILNCNFSRFNEKIRAKEDELVKAMSKPTGKLVGCLAYTGINGLAEPSRRDLDDFLKEVNDVSSYLSFRVLNQQELYRFLTRSIGGDPINIDIGLKNWGWLKEPSPAYYGQVNGEEIKGWWDKNGISLLAKNIRSSLGDTEVNHEINETILSNPEKFWYFNNGITLIAKKINKTLVGGGDRDYGTFHCEDVSVVNGAQTLSTIGKIDTIFVDNLSQLFVPLRIISLENSDDMFGERITKANNLQNRIESRDFVSLDPEQQRLKVELSMEGITYSIKRDSDFAAGPSSFDLSESTTALACASGDIGVIVQLKREVGKVWDDIKRPPYTTIFNRSVSSTYLYRCVLINREVDKQILSILGGTPLEASVYGIGVHGNRMISGLVFWYLDKKIIGDPTKDFDSYLASVDLKKLTSDSFFLVSQAVEKIFPSPVLPTLFKNRNKCQEIFDACKSWDCEEEIGSSRTDGQMELL